MAETNIIKKENGAERQVAGYDGINLETALDFLSDAAQLECDQRDDVDYVINTSHKQDDGTTLHRHTLIRHSPYTAVAEFHLVFEESG